MIDELHYRDIVNRGIWYAIRRRRRHSENL